MKKLFGVFVLCFVAGISNANAALDEWISYKHKKIYFQYDDWRNILDSPYVEDWEYDLKNIQDLIDFNTNIIDEQIDFYNIMTIIYELDVVEYYKSYEIEWLMNHSLEAYGCHYDDDKEWVGDDLWKMYYEIYNDFGFLQFKIDTKHVNNLERFLDEYIPIMENVICVNYVVSRYMGLVDNPAYVKYER